MTRRSHCPTCRQPILDTLDDDTCALPITIHPTPTTRRHALLAIVAGYRVVFAEHSREHRNHRTRYYALDPWRIPNQRLATYPHYIEHICGHTPPPAEKPQTIEKEIGECPF